MGAKMKNKLEMRHIIHDTTTNVQNGLVQSRPNMKGRVKLR